MRPNGYHGHAQIEQETNNPQLILTTPCSLGLDICIRYLAGMCDFNDLGVRTVTDASFAGELGMKSQQGRMHFLCPSSQVRDPKCEKFTVLPISYVSTTIKRVCRATLQAEAYSLQSGVESGYRIRGLLYG